jgi:photosystem II stability/assembly factor-like uncharacterized protein
MDLKDSTGLIAGYGGMFHISRDSGSTWQSKSLGTSDYIQFVDIVSSDTFFLASPNGKVFRTYNGGNTWVTLNCGRQISSIEFINSKVGYVGATSAYILKTVDGGSTWQQNVSVNIIPSNTIAIQFFDINTGFAFRGHSDLLSTKDGGVTWNKYNMDDNIYAFHFISREIGFAAGRHGVMYKTSDGGVTWNWMSPDFRIDAYNLNSIYFINATIGFAVGTRGRILKTLDGGTTWTSYSPTYNDVQDLALASSNTAYATVGNKLFKTQDTGRTWQQLEFMLATTYATYNSFGRAYFFNADTGFVTAAPYARTYKTYDGGTSWKQINVSPSGYDNVTDIQFLNKSTGYLALYIYSQGSIVKTMDQGETWKEVWSAQYQGEFFEKLFFVDEKTGYASRYKGLYKTIDSAKTWIKQWENERILSISFLNAQTGFVCGENGMLQRTNDSGKTWTKIPIVSQFYDDIYKIKFIDQRVGFITTENGAIYKSVDGGLTWTLWNKASYYKLETIQFGSDASVYFAGQFGAILRSTLKDFNFGTFSSTSTNCSADLQIAVTTIMGSADSLQFEYGTSTLDKTIAASPSSVVNDQQLVKATLTNLLPATTYKARLKLFFNGKYNYSNTYSFTTGNKPGIPTISYNGSITFCQGDSLVLNSSAITGNQWLLNGSILANETNQRYIVRETGKYQLVRKVGCFTSDTASLTVTVTPLPPKPVITQLGNTITSSASKGNQWYLAGTAIVGGTEQDYKVQVSGLYTVQVSQNGCSILSDPYNFVATALLSPDDWNREVSIYPNPVKKTLFIKNTSTRKLDIEIIDPTGKIVYKENSKVSDFSIDMSILSAGIYHIRLKDARKKEMISFQVVKQ